jgi:hypothetical protein
MSQDRHYVVGGTRHAAPHAARTGRWWRNIREARESRSVIDPAMPIWKVVFTARTTKVPEPERGKRGGGPGA